MLTFMQEKRSLYVGVPACAQEREPLRGAYSVHERVRVVLRVVIEMYQLGDFYGDLRLYCVRPEFGLPAGDRCDVEGDVESQRCGASGQTCRGAGGRCDPASASDSDVVSHGSF